MGFQFSKLFFILKKYRKHLIITLLLVVGLAVGTILANTKLSLDPRKKATEPPTVTVVVNGAAAKSVSPGIWGVNFGPMLSNSAGPDSFMNGFNIPALRDRLGIKSIRYMGGCNGDFYNPKPQTIDTHNVTVLQFRQGGQSFTKYAPTIDRVIAFANAIGADITYQINMETQGLGTPCGTTPLYPAGDRETQLRTDLTYILTNYPSIRSFELGNESWSAWEVEDYVAKAISFAGIIKSFNSAIKVGIIGFPTSGNNQDPGTTLENDTAWTAAVVQAITTQICNGVPCFDFVTDHPYLYHGYSDPAKWPFPTPQARPDNQPGNIPSYQFFSQSLLSADGRTGYNFNCPINYTKGGLWGWECTWWSSPIDLTSLRGIGNERYKGLSGFTVFNADGTQKFRQSILNDTGTTVWGRTCPVDDASTGTGIQWAECSSWNEYQLGNYINTQPGDQTFAAFSGLAYFDNANRQVIRQSLVMRDRDPNRIWQRTCFAPNGVFNPSDCLWGGWNFSIPLINGSPIGPIEGFTSSRFFGLALGGSGNGPQKQYIREAILLENGQTYYYRVCEVAADSSINCPINFKSASLESVRNQGGESYSEISQYSFFTNNQNVFSFPYNFPGISAYYTAKDAAIKIQTRLDDYSPSRLAITEWNQKCWGGGELGNRNPSLGTVDQGFYTAEMLLQMADKGVLYGSHHDLTEQANPNNNGCSLFRSQSGESAELNAAGKAYALTSVIAGGTNYQTYPNGFLPGNAPVFSLPDNPRCNQSGCLRGGYNISKISSYAAYNSDQSKFFIFILNRDTQNEAVINLQLNNVPNLNSLTHYKIKILWGASFSDADFYESETGSLVFQPDTAINVPATSIARVELFYSSPSPTSTPTPFPTLPPPPTPTPTPLPAYKVFNSSTQYRGNLGGLTGADAKCQARAGAAGLTGTFKAWLSTSTIDAKDRIPDVRYVLVDGTTTVADNKADLIDGSIQNKINKTESGSTASYLSWTGTKGNGTKDTSTCSNWTSVGNGLNGVTGYNIFVNSKWTKLPGLSNCYSSKHLYCFQTAAANPPTPTPTPTSPPPTPTPRMEIEEVLSPTPTPNLDI